MAPSEQDQSPSAGASGDHKSIIDALMALLAEKPFEEIGLAEVASRAGVSLAQMRAHFSSLAAILAAQVKETDRAVLSNIDADMAQEPVRERLFDVLMRRLEVLSPHKAAIRSLLRSSCRNPALALMLNGLSTRSAQWMLTAADINVTGPKGMMRAQGLALLYGRVICTWINDDDPGLARTMAALDRELARGERWAGFLDDLCLIPDLFMRRGGWRARRRRDRDEESIVA